MHAPGIAVLDGVVPANLDVTPRRYAGGSARPSERHAERPYRQSSDEKVPAAHCGVLPGCSHLPSPAPCLSDELEVATKFGQLGRHSPAFMWGFTVVPATPARASRLFSGNSSSIVF